MHGVQLPVLVHKEDAWNCRWALVQNGENSLICGLTSLLRRLWHVNVRPRYQRWKVDNANTNKKVSTNKTFHSYWCGVSPLLSSVSLVIRRFLLLLPTPPLLRLKYEEAMDRIRAQKWMIKIWMLRMQTNTKKKSPVLQQLRPPVPMMPHLGSTSWREEGVWLIQSLVRFDSKSKKNSLSLTYLPSLLIATQSYLSVQIEQVRFD